MGNAIFLTFLFMQQLSLSLPLKSKISIAHVFDIQYFYSSKKKWSQSVFELPKEFVLLHLPAWPWRLHQFILNSHYLQQKWNKNRIKNDLSPVELYNSFRPRLYSNVILYFYWSLCRMTNNWCKVLCVHMNSVIIRTDSKGWQLLFYEAIVCNGTCLPILILK